MNKRRIFNQSLWLVLALVLPFSVRAQQQQQTAPQTEKTISRPAAQVQTLRLDSRLTAREMPYRVILPNDYEAKEKAVERYPVV
ncbi:MAG TPA: hypothetical protein VGB68_05770, partial [Pyrinomonadaceae bacterium]